MSETLKYFYLISSDPDKISLDDLSSTLNHIHSEYRIDRFPFLKNSELKALWLIS
jgi:hypothetical protein